MTLCITALCIAFACLCVGGLIQAGRITAQEKRIDELEDAVYRGIECACDDTEDAA